MVNRRLVNLRPDCPGDDSSQQDWAWQIDRIAQFDMRLDEKRKVAESAQAKRQTWAFPGGV
jgi:hypothetical protein